MIGSIEIIQRQKDTVENNQKEIEKIENFVYTLKNELKLVDFTLPENEKKIADQQNKNLSNLCEPIIQDLKIIGHF